MRACESPTRSICALCHAAGATFRYGGIVQADEAHRLCFRCYRAEVTRHRTALDRLRRALTGSGPAGAGLGRAPRTVEGPLALDLWGE